MKTKQTIAIIGATGNMGSALAKNLAGGNYRLLLYASKLPERKKLMEEIMAIHPMADIEAADCQTEATWEADLIILAVPYEAEPAIAEKIREMANQKIVISITNPLNASYDGLVTAPDTSAAELLQQLLPNASVIKAFNTTFAADFAAPVIEGKKIDAFIAGNDKEALDTVQELVETAGFNPIIAGNLTVSRTLENMQLLLIQLGLKYKFNWHAGWKILHN